MTSTQALKECDGNKKKEQSANNNKCMLVENRSKK